MSKHRSHGRTFAHARRRFWRSERGATIVEYGLVAAMAVTALGAFDVPRDRSEHGTPVACAAGDRNNAWLDKDAVTRESCAAARPARPRQRV